MKKILAGILFLTFMGACYAEDCPPLKLALQLQKKGEFDYDKHKFVFTVIPSEDYKYAFLDIFKIYQRFDGPSCEYTDEKPYDDYFRPHLTNNQCIYPYVKPRESCERSEAYKRIRIANRPGCRCGWYLKKLC